MARKKKGAHGGHGWFVTFADLMGLLMAFFVVVAAFSSQDKAKMMALLGSMKEAFGSSKNSALAGMTEIDGLPTRPYVRDMTLQSGQRDEQTAPTSSEGERQQGPERATSDTPVDSSRDPRRFDGAIASIRQAMSAMPEVADQELQVVTREEKRGLIVEIVDQDGRAMFPAGSPVLTERAARMMSALGPVLAKLPNHLVIAGHTTAVPSSASARMQSWQLSSERAASAAVTLFRSGLPLDRVSSIEGRGDAEPYFSDATLSPNNRVTLLLLDHAAALPVGHRP